jgi:hopene-associated glycosyltransferase HpnB
VSKWRASRAANRRGLRARAGVVEDPLGLHVIAAIPVVVWAWLLAARGGFWRVAPQSVRSPLPQAPPARRVIVIIPARNEAAVIGTAVTSLVQQSFAGAIHLIVIDDESNDGTADAAVSAARGCGACARLTVIRGAPLPRGWTGKLWALSQGVMAAAPFDPDYLLFTDADIEHGRESVESLVAEAEACHRDLVSRMVRLSTATVAERLLIPAFVFFFFMLYPPAWIAAAERRTAAAAGGCILIRPQALARIGGLEVIRSSIIDDCALARAVKASGGRLSLKLTREVRSLRVYGSFASIGTMISRSAFAQLRHSYLVLIGTLLGLFITYLLAPVMLFLGDPVAAGLGVAALVLMSLAYLPIVRFHGLAASWCLCLPPIVLFYAAAVLHSVARYAQGKGGRWKGRAQDTVY